jgi:hypothetical protein
MTVFAGIIPTHAMIAERIPGCSYSERQLVGADWMAGVCPHLSTRMTGFPQQRPNGGPSKTVANRRHCHFRDLRKGISLLVSVPVGSHAAEGLE